MAKFQPIIKWSGSKRSQSDEILKYFPKEIDTYYEPFCGGASILFSLLKNENIKVNRYVISDINEDLICLWRMIKNDPNTLKNTYRILWTKLKNKKTISEKKAYYENVRNTYNEDHEDPAYFLFLNRTCFNGLIRYNSNGDFNTSYHLNRDGIRPDKLDKIIDEWSFLLNEKNVEIYLRDYSEIIPKEGDFIYLDPPYMDTKGMYLYNKFNQIDFFVFLNNLKCSYILSYNGISGNDNKIFDVPENVYDEHILIKSGNSSFKRITESEKDAMVYESLYISKK